MNFELSTGGIPSPKDERDWTLASVGASTVYPSSAFIERVKELFVNNQGKIGSCVGNTFEEIVRLIVWTIALEKDPNAKQEELSWRFVYALCKALEGTVGYENFPKHLGEGTYPALAAKVVRKYGVAHAKYCPNDITLPHEDFVYNRDLSKIPADALTDGLTRKAGADLTNPITEEGIKQAIDYAKKNNGGVAILRRIGDTYWKDVDGNGTWDKSKLLPIRVPSTIVSGHEELLYGYDIDPANGRTRIYWLNSWSKEWADDGKGWEYLDVWLPLINELRVTVAALPEPPTTFKYTFTKTLKKGSKGADVIALQHVLSLEGCFDYTAFTGNYGDITVAGVKKLQEKYADIILKPLGLSVGTGFFGNATLKWANSKYGA